MIPKEDISRLAEAKIFADASRDRVIRWLGAIPGYCEEYRSGQVIHFQGDRYDRLIMLVEGSAEASMQDPSGKVMKVETLEAPEAVAAAVLFSSEQLLPVTLSAETQVRLFRMKRETLLELLLKERKLLENLLTDMGDRLVFLAEKVKYIRFASLRQKIAGYLLELSSRAKSDELQLSYTREKLSEMFGVERPSLSREISRMDDEGLIHIDGRYVKILDRGALEDFLEEM